MMVDNYKSNKWIDNYNCALISIIVPVYDSELYIKDCIESLLNQTYKLYEIIFVDDGSTDGSVEIIKDYASKHSFIKIIEQENRKVGAARNKGLENSKGEYILFLDSDDWLECNALEKLIIQAKSNTLDMLLFDALIKNEIEGYSYSDGWYDRSGLGIDKNRVYSGYKLCQELHSIGAGIVTPCLALYSKSFLLENKLKFLENVFYEDNDFTVRAYFYAKRLMYNPEKLYCRRIRCNSITTSHLPQIQYESKLIVFKECLIWMIFNVEKNKDVFWKYIMSFLSDNIIVTDYDDIKVDDNAELLFSDVLLTISHHFEILSTIVLCKGVLLFYDLLEMVNKLGFCDATLKDDINNKIRDYFIDEIDDCSVLAIYGAGVNGKNIANHFNKMGIKEKVIFIESDAKEKRLLEYNVISVSQMKTYNISRIIISSLKYEEEIRVRLCQECGKEILNIVDSYY